MSTKEFFWGAMTKLITINYTLWRSWMEDLLNCNDLFRPLDATGKNFDPTKEVKWKKLNRKMIRSNSESIIMSSCMWHKRQMHMPSGRS